MGYFENEAPAPPLVARGQWEERLPTGKFLWWWCGLMVDAKSEEISGYRGGRVSGA